MAGTLYLVATPIGNLGDFSPRAAETLETVDFIAAEDTRVTVKLLNHLGIKKPMVSYYRRDPCHQRPRGGAGGPVRRPGHSRGGDPGGLRLCERFGCVRPTHGTLYL